MNCLPGRALQAANTSPREAVRFIHSAVFSDRNKRSGKNGVRRQVCVSFRGAQPSAGLRFVRGVRPALRGPPNRRPLLSTHPAVAIAVELVPSGRRATGLGLPAHADAQVAVLVHAELHVGKFPGTCRVLNAHALAFLPGPPAAVAAVKERQVHAAPGRTGGRKQRHPSICHCFPSFDRRMGPVNYLL